MKESITNGWRLLLLSNILYSFHNSVIRNEEQVITQKTKFLDFNFNGKQF
jgi:hypothetical protein